MAIDIANFIFILKGVIMKFEPFTPILFHCHSSAINCHRKLDFNPKIHLAVLNALTPFTLISLHCLSNDIKYHYYRDKLWAVNWINY